MVFQTGKQFNHRLRLSASVTLIERIPPENWDSRHDPEWVVDIDGADSRMFNLPGGATTVMPESLIQTEFTPFVPARATVH